MLPVLIVEPHLELRNAITLVLDRNHVDNQAVASPADAMLKLRGTEYSHIVVDGDSGVDMTLLYDMLSRNPALLAKVIIISDGDSPASMVNQPMLVKPFDTHQLLAPLKQ